MDSVLSIITNIKMAWFFLDIELIKLPKIKDAPEFENNFYFTCKNDRISKLLIQYELFLMSQRIPGDIVECGVFKGSSLIRFAIFRDLFKKKSKKIIGFDTFGKFPIPQKNYDKKFVKMWKSKAGDALDDNLLKKIIYKKKLKNFKFVKGDIFFTLDKFLKSYKKKIALLHLDLDTYDISKFVLKRIYKHLSKKSIILCDDYKSTTGATKAINEFLKEKNYKISILKNHKNPYFILVNKIKN